jgi:hypothetical protein
MMAAWAALQSGLKRAFTSVRLVMTVTLLNLAFAVLAILPLVRALHGLLSPGGAASGVLAAWPSWFDAEFRAHSGEALGMFDLQAGAVVLLYTLLSSFLTAGALSVLHDGDGAFSLGGFLRGAARYGSRFLRLLALFLCACWLLSWLAGFQLGEIVRWLQHDWPSQRGAFIMGLGHEIALLVLFYTLTCLFDYARIRMVVEGRSSALGSTLAAVVFTLRNPAGTFLIFGLLALGQAVVILMAGELVSRLPAGTPGGLLGFFVLAQIIVAVRFAFRLAYLECGRLWLMARLDLH